MQEPEVRQQENVGVAAVGLLARALVSGAGLAAVMVLSRLFG